MSADLINSRIIPTLALRGLVMFPGALLHFDVGRKKSVAALEKAMGSDRLIFLLSQKEIITSEPDVDDLYKVGCVAKIKQLVKMPNNTVRVIVEGVSRAKYIEINMGGAYYKSEILYCEEKPMKCSELHKEAYLRRVRDKFEQYAQLADKIPPDVISMVMTSQDIAFISDYIVSNIPASLDDKQFILEEIDPIKRIKLSITLLDQEYKILQIDAKISSKVKEQVEENQREYYLREQLKAIGSELYGADNPQIEVEEYIEKIEMLFAPESIKEKLCDETFKLTKMPQGSHEASVLRGYLDTCLELPFGILTKDRTNIDRAVKILDRDHYGLKKIKERILELLSVYQFSGDIKGQIICLVGPPGVGKTSISKSIAECLGRNFARVSLGGVGDEAEIRGHRRTYIGAMPGRIVNAVKLSKSSNPVILLDEIDKLGASGYKGDAAAALLETLDSEQNSSFRDHYIDLPFDLSRVLFIATANTLDSIPRPLIDRMEIIEISSYSREDKFHITKDHLCKKRLNEMGLGKLCKFNDDTLYSIIDDYTREAGVRQANRLIASLCRKAAHKLARGDVKRVVIKSSDLKEYLGAAKFKNDNIAQSDEIGVVNGLAWTSIGGEILPLEVSVLNGDGKIILTGSLGDVMKESAQTAVSYVRSKAEEYGIDQNFYKKVDIHIHALNAAVPKDGPSAGVTITTAIISALTNKAVDHTVAMTGEISLKGKVLPIGGLPEKTMAAYKYGVKNVFIPADNESDIADFDETVINNVNIITVTNVSEILDRVLQKKTEDNNVDLPIVAACKDDRTVIRQ